MPAPSLPVAIEPFKWADRAAHVVADVPLSSFPRLSESVMAREGSVQVRCRFERGAQHVAWLRGSLETTVFLTCQRCLEALEMPVSIEVALALVHDEEEAGRLSDDTDYIVVPEQDVVLADILEDELLLALPYIPAHEHCELKYQGVVEAGSESRRENPFQVLAALKKPSAKE